MEITIKLHDVRDKLPDKSGDYICVDHYGRWWQLHYSTRNRAFNSHDRDEVATYALYPDYWAELPEIKEDDSEQNTLA